MSIEWILLIVIGIVGLIVQGKLQSVFSKYSKVPMAGGLTGREVAEKMLRENGVYNVQVISTRGHLTDHYNPANKTINLSESVYNSTSVAAAAVAAHETGHALQDACEYAPLRLRSALVPVISFSSQWAFIVILFGLFLINTMPAVFWLGIAMIAISAVFSLVTFPVEFDATARAMPWLQSVGTLNVHAPAQPGAACQCVSTSSCVDVSPAIATLLYYIGIARRE